MTLPYVKKITMTRGFPVKRKTYWVGLGAVHRAMSKRLCKVEDGTARRTTAFICGDYFFLEALSAFEGRAPDFWGPERNGMLE